MAFIDCDLYSSTRDVLSWLENLLKDGSILIFDDWETFGNNPGLGQQRAFGEFLRDNLQVSVEPLRKYKYQGQSFLVRKRSPDKGESNIIDVARFTK